MALPGGDGGTITQAGQHFHSWPNRLDARCADEYSVEWAAGLVGGAHRVQRRNRQIGLEAVHLPSEGVAGHREVHQPQQGRVSVPAPPAAQSAGQEDQAGAGAPDRFPRTSHLADRFQQPVFHGQLTDSRALPAGDDQPVQAVEVLWPAYPDCLHI